MADATPEPAMPNDNAEQIAEWNGTLGQRWAESQRETDAVVAAFGEAALQRAAARPGERVIDIGCGCGDTALALARQVGETGQVLGVDVSQPMLAVARQRAAAAGLRQLRFDEADASVAPLAAGIDLLYSRFGVMFFADPVAAFKHLHAALRPGGRLVFVCWRAPRDNSWAMAPLVAARKVLGITPPPADPLAPGPFAFADGERTRSILADAGFSGIELQRVDAPIRLGATAREAAEGAVRVGPTARLAREAGPEHLPAILQGIERALAAQAASDGQVSLGGSTWLVSASRP